MEHGKRSVAPRRTSGPACDQSSSEVSRSWGRWKSGRSAAIRRDGTVARRMYRFLLRPRWIAFTLVVVTAIAVMINLGFWQLRRLDERQTFNDAVAARIDQPAVDLDELVPADATVGDSELADVEWRPVEASGRYLPEEELRVVNRSQGGRAGDNVMTPLLLDDGRVLLVARGFVPLDTEPAPAPDRRRHRRQVGSVDRRYDAPRRCPTPTRATSTWLSASTSLALPASYPATSCRCTSSSPTPIHLSPAISRSRSPNRRSARGRTCRTPCSGSCSRPSWRLAGSSPSDAVVEFAHEAALRNGRDIPQHGDAQHVRARVVAEHLRRQRPRRRRVLRRHPQPRRAAARSAGSVPSPARRGAARTRPAVLDRGSRLRSRLPRPSSRRTPARHAATAQRCRSAGSTPARSTAPDRSGSCTSSMGSTEVGWQRRSRRSTTPRSTARRAR